MSDDDDKLPAHQDRVAGVGGNPTVPQPPAKPITDEVLDPGTQATRDKHERHKRHRAKGTMTAEVEHKPQPRRTMTVEVEHKPQPRRTMTVEVERSK